MRAQGGTGIPVVNDRCAQYKRRLLGRSFAKSLNRVYDVVIIGVMTSTIRRIGSRSTRRVLNHIQNPLSITADFGYWIF